MVKREGTSFFVKIRTALPTAMTAAKASWMVTKEFWTEAFWTGTDSAWSFGMTAAKAFWAAEIAGRPFSGLSPAVATLRTGSTHPRTRHARSQTSSSADGDNFVGPKKGRRGDRKTVRHSWSTPSEKRRRCQPFRLQMKPVWETSAGENRRRQWPPVPGGGASCFYGAACCLVGGLGGLLAHPVARDGPAALAPSWCIAAT
jgi:hypothetical protein